MLLSFITHNSESLSLRRTTPLGQVFYHLKNLSLKKGAIFVEKVDSRLPLYASIGNVLYTITFIILYINY